MIATAALGLGWRQTWLDFVGVARAGALFLVTYVFSAWPAGVVKQMDSAPELQTRVAVAEERLRFGRDIHDVMGPQPRGHGPEERTAPSSSPSGEGPRP